MSNSLQLLLLSLILLCTSLAIATATQATVSQTGANWAGFPVGQRGTGRVCCMPRVFETRHESLLALSPLPPSNPPRNTQRQRKRRNAASAPPRLRERLFKVRQMTVSVVMDMDHGLLARNSTVVRQGFPFYLNSIYNFNELKLYRILPEEECSYEYTMDARDIAGMSTCLNGQEWTLLDTVKLAGNVPARVYRTHSDIPIEGQGNFAFDAVFTLTQGCIPMNIRLEGTKVISSKLVRFATSTLYSNYVTSIRDPSVFQVPASCDAKYPDRIKALRDTLTERLAEFNTLPTN